MKMNEEDDKCAGGSVQKQVSVNPDSLSIGSASKGGVIKVYGDFCDAEAFKEKIKKAVEVMSFAKSSIEL